MPLKYGAEEKVRSKIMTFFGRGIFLAIHAYIHKSFEFKMEVVVGLEEANHIA